MQPNHNKSRIHWLLVGAFIGAVLAATGLVENQLRPIQEETIATIDGEAISLARYNSVVQALQKDRGKPLTDTDRARLVERMIDEKLLLQHAEHLGLTRNDAAVKKAIVDAVIENIVSENRGAITETAELERFYRNNLSYFSHTPVVSVQRMVFRGVEAQQQAQLAHVALESGEVFASVKLKLASEDVLQLPTSPIPQNRLTNYIGPSLAKAVAELEPGQFTSPLATGGSFVILGLMERLPGQSPSLETIRDQVTREFQRRQDDQALQDYLAELKANAEIRINQPLLLRQGKTLSRD